jgi:hypothetical protein
MSFSFNPANGIKSASRTPDIAGHKGSLPEPGGLPISPGRVCSCGANAMTVVTYLLLGLGFFAATVLFIAALITTILA